jgi:1-acyl-sn-glycerol-3-phosphate acyltransferase
MTGYRVLTWLTRPVVRIVFRPRVSGRERVPRSGFVLSANHLSGFDSFAIAQALGSRPVHNMAKNELFEQRALRWLVGSLGAFPAHRRGSIEGGVGHATALAAAGAVVAIFPAGVRRRKATVVRPRTGAARTALAAGVPLLPVAVRGTDGWRRLQRWSVVVGDPIPLDDLAGRKPLQAAREATRRLWLAIGELEATLEAESGAESGTPRALRTRLAPVQDRS